MHPSKNIPVQKFLEDLLFLNETQSRMIEELRKRVFLMYPQVQERMMYGGIMFSLEKDFGGLFVSKNHISFEFGNGYNMDDSAGFLEGSGKFRRHLKFLNFEDIERKKVDLYIKQAR